MFWLLRAGGAPGVVVALLGLIALVLALRFARWPDPARLELARALSRATLYAIGAGTASCLAAVFLHVARWPELSHAPDRHLIVLEGLAESMSPAIVGFSLLTLTAILKAIGEHRLQRA